MSFDVIYRFSFPFVQLHAGSLRDGTGRFRQRMGFETCSSTGLLLFCLVCRLCWFALFFAFYACLHFYLPHPAFFALFYFCFILVFVAYFAFLNQCFLLSPKHIIINICVLYIFPIEHLQQQVVGRRLFQVWLKWTRRKGCSRTKNIIFCKISFIQSKGNYGWPTRGVLVQKDCKEERAYRERQGRFLLSDVGAHCAILSFPFPINSILR